VHGHGILHLQTSNQSPETFQFGILLVAAAAIRFDAKGTILVFYISQLKHEFTITNTEDIRSSVYNLSICGILLLLQPLLSSENSRLLSVPILVVLLVVPLMTNISLIGQAKRYH
jgi:hypothetical protein